MEGETDEFEYSVGPLEDLLIREAQLAAYFVGAAYNLLRMAKLLAA